MSLLEYIYILATLNKDHLLDLQEKQKRNFDREGYTGNPKRIVDNQMLRSEELEIHCCDAASTRNNIPSLHKYRKKNSNSLEGHYPYNEEVQHKCLDQKKLDYIFLCIFPLGFSVFVIVYLVYYIQGK